MADAAAQVSGVAREELVALVVNHLEIQPLVLQILDVAARTNSTETLAALGAVLGDAAVVHHRTLDENVVIAAALRDLGPVHVRLLDVMTRTPADVLGDNPNTAWTGAKVRMALPDLAPSLVQGALGGLIRHGLVNITSPWSAVGYEMSDFGRAMLGVFAASRDY